jgi:hypothetical protein
MPGATGAALDAHRALGHLRRRQYPRRTGADRRLGLEAFQRDQDGVPMQAQPPHESRAFFLESIHAHHLGELDRDGLDAPLDRRARDAEAHGHRLVGLTANDGTEHLDRLQCVLVVLVDLLVVLHDLLLPSSLDRHQPECSSADAPFARRKRRERRGISSSGRARRRRRRTGRPDR